MVNILKYLILAVAIGVFDPCTAFSQVLQTNIASVKFRLTDFKNPNEFLQRPGLVRFSRENKLLAVSGRSTDIIIYDLATGEIRSKIDGKGYNAFSFLPGGKTALARDNDFQLRVFDLEDGKMLRELKGIVTASDEGAPFIGLNAGLEMQPIDLSSDYKKVLIVRGTRTSEIADFETGNTLHRLRNPDKSRAGIMLLKAAYGLESSFLVGLSTLKQETSFTPDGTFVLVSNMSRTATLWNVESGEMATKIGPLENTIVNEAFSPDGKLLATTDSEGVTMIWSIPEGKRLSTIGSEKDSNYIAAWSPDSNLIWTIAYKENARSYDARTGKLIMTLADSKASGIAYSSDGKFVLTKTATNKKSFGSVWEAESGTLVAPIPRSKNDEMPYRLLFDPLGRYVIAASKKDVKIWDIKGKLLQNLENAVFPVRFSNDGQLLVTGGKKDTGYVWNIR